MVPPTSRDRSRLRLLGPMHQKVRLSGAGLDVAVEHAPADSEDIRHVCTHVALVAHRVASRFSPG